MILLQKGYCCIFCWPMFKSDFLLKTIHKLTNKRLFFNNWDHVQGWQGQAAAQHRKIDYWPLHWPMKNILRSLGHNPSSSLHGLFGPQSAPGILKYMFECLIFVLMGWIWNVMWDNWFVIQFNLIASSDERKVGIYFGGTEQKPAFFFSRSISSHPSNKYNHGSNNCLLLFVFYLVRLKKTNRKKATVRPSETIKKHQHQQQGPAVVLLSIYLFCCYVCWLSVLVEYNIQGVR